MSSLAERITEELRALLGQPIGDCWRGANMQIFGFGPRQWIVNRKGEEVEACEVRLHIQCRWRFVDSERILFARDDLNYPADENVLIEDFDWDQQESVLDATQRAWFAGHRDPPPQVGDVRGDAYGGFRIEFDGGFALECFPCDSRRGEYSERWRLFGHRADGSHFVITGDGIEA
jgi:hypothetical protein